MIDTCGARQLCREEGVGNRSGTVGTRVEQCSQAHLRIFVLEGVVFDSCFKMLLSEVEARVLTAFRMVTGQTQIELTTDWIEQGISSLELFSVCQGRTNWRSEVGTWGWDWRSGRHLRHIASGFSAHVYEFADAG